MVEQLINIQGYRLQVCAAYGSDYLFIKLLIKFSQQGISLHLACLHLFLKHFPL